MKETTEQLKELVAQAKGWIICPYAGVAVHESGLSMRMDNYYTSIYPEFSSKSMKTYLQQKNAKPIEQLYQEGRALLIQGISDKVALLGLNMRHVQEKQAKVLKHKNVGH